MDTNSVLQESTVNEEDKSEAGPKDLRVNIESEDSMIHPDSTVASVCAALSRKHEQTLAALAWCNNARSHPLQPVPVFHEGDISFLREIVRNDIPEGHIEVLLQRITSSDSSSSSDNEDLDDLNYDCNRLKAPGNVNLKDTQ